MSSAEEQAEQHRIKGITFFDEGRFEAAIDAYTAAITLCPDVPTYWTNRAMCYHMLKDWEKLESDCKHAIQLDNQFVKAHFVLGYALVHKKEYAEGIKELEKALDLRRGGTPSGCKVEVISQKLAEARGMKWNHDITERSRVLQNLREAFVAALKGKHSRDGSQTEAFVDENVNSTQNQLEALDRVLKKAAENDIPTEVPHHLRCSITLDIFFDPVITPSGITYEREAILRHLQTVGKFDPITRVPLHPCQLVPNLAIEGAAQAFIEKVCGPPTR